LFRLTKLRAAKLKAKYATWRSYGTKLDKRLVKTQKCGRKGT
jgi:hypothetical protein